jgi:hypothetical protein
MIRHGMTHACVVGMLQDLLNDDLFVALYTDDADLSPQTKTYATRGETKGQGYVAGGQKLTDGSVRVEKDCVYLTFSDPIWHNSNISATGCMVYNKSKGNRALVVARFSEPLMSRNGNAKVSLLADGLLSLHLD